MFDLLPRLQIPLVLAIAGALGAAVIALRRQIRRLRVHLAAATRLGDTAARSEQAGTRRVQLAAHDLRGIGMSLQGHADQLIATQHASAAGLAAAAADLLDMADDLQGHGVDAGAPRMLRPEDLALAAMLHEAVAAVSLSIAPGRRTWRIAADLDDAIVHFDARALRHMLRRVLIDAVRNTRQDDWIDIGIEHRERELMLVVADEGSGNATPETEPTAARDSRGIGLRLSLARALMTDHGGRIDVEARVGVGTRVSLVFPAARIRRNLAAA